MKHKFKDFIFDTERAELTYLGKSVHINRQCRTVLETLLAANGRVVPDKLMDEALCKLDSFESETSVIVSNLRTVFRNAGETENLIKKTTQMGYRLTCDIQKVPDDTNTWIETMGGGPTDNIDDNLHPQAEFPSEMNDDLSPQIKSPELSNGHQEQIDEVIKPNGLFKWTPIAVLILSAISISVGYMIWNSISIKEADKTGTASGNTNTSVHARTGEPTPALSPTPETAVKFEPTRVLDEQVGIAGSSDFSPDGEFFATGSSDGKVRIWETDSWKFKGAMPDGGANAKKSVHSVAFSPDSTILVSGESDNTIKIWNMQDGSLMRTIPAHTGKSNYPGVSGVASVSFAKDGTLLVSAGFDGSICIWDKLKDWQPFEISRRPEAAFLSAIFSRDGKYILSISSKGGIQFWSNNREFQTGPSKTLREEKKFTSIVFSPEGTFLAGAQLEDNKIMLWKTQPLEDIKPLNDHEHTVSSIFFVTDRQLISGSYDNKVNIGDVIVGGSKNLDRKSGSRITALKVSPDGGTLAICGKTVEIWSQK